MYQALVHNTRPLTELSSNIQYSTSSQQFVGFKQPETMKMLEVDLFKIAVPIPRSRFPTVSTTNAFLGKREIFVPVPDPGAKKVLKTDSNPQFQLFFESFMKSLPQHTMEVSGKIPESQKIEPKVQNPASSKPPKISTQQTHFSKDKPLGQPI